VNPARTRGDPSMRKRALRPAGHGEHARFSAVVRGLVGRRDGVGRREEPPRDESGCRAHGGNQRFHRLLRDAVARALTAAPGLAGVCPAALEDSHRSGGGGAGAAPRGCRAAMRTHRRSVVIESQTSSGRLAIAAGGLAMRSRMCQLDRQSPRGRFGWLCGSNNGGRLCDSVRDDAHQPGARRGWLKPARRAGRVPFGLRCSGLGAGWVAGGCAVRGEEGEVVPGDVSEDFDDVLRCGFRAGVVEL